MITLTSEEDFHRLHRIVDGKSKTIRVRAEDLDRLLIDHARMVNELLDHGVAVDGYSRIHVQTQRKAVRETL